MRAYRWGILAPGSIAHRFAQGLSVCENAERYAVGSRDAGRAEAFRERYAFKRAYGSYEEFASDPALDVAYVATPHPHHTEAAILLMERGKHVLCEKPLAANAAQAARMIACARANGVFLMEGIWTRFLPSIVRLRELIAEGAIGEVRRVEANFGFRAQTDPNGRLFAPAMAGGSLLDVGVYNVAFARMVFGARPSAVDSKLHLGETGVDEEAALSLTYPSGATASLYSAIRVNTPQDATVFGTEGSIYLPSYWHGDTLILRGKDGEAVTRFPFESTGFQFEAAAVMECLARGEKESPVMPLDESLENMRLMDAVRAEHGLAYPFEEGGE